MSAETLGVAFISFESGPKTYPLACADHELELLFQARHEAWARNRIEARRGMVSEESHRADCEAFAAMSAGNLFAFAGRLSLTFVFSDEGMAEYVLLLSQKGQKEQGGDVLSKSLLRSMRKGAPGEWERLIRLVMGRDFPNALKGLPAGETPTPITNGSGNSSRESPIESPTLKSSA